MLRHEEERLKVSLTEVIDAWLAEANNLPATGDETAEIMAEAAINILRAMASVEDYFIANDMIKE